MTFGGAPTVFRLRQAQATRNWRLGLLALATVAYTFAGSGVYWLKTGSGTVGEGGTVSNLGALIWFFPAAGFLLMILILKDRGPFRAFYDPRTTVTVDPDGLSWWTAKAGDGRLAWSDLGGVSRIKGRDSTYEPVYGMSAEEVIAFEGPFKVEGRRKSVSLPTIILEARPNNFVPIDPGHPERGCVTRSPRGPGFVTRST
jgi:hypothetical protein